MRKHKYSDSGPEVSLRIAGTPEQFRQVKRMIRGLGTETVLAYSQTLNGRSVGGFLIEPLAAMKGLLVGQLW